MELRTRLKPHILSVQMTVKRSSGAFLGESPACLQALGSVLGRDQWLATRSGFSCPAPCNKPIMDQRGCSPSSNRAFISMRREEGQGTVGSQTIIFVLFSSWAKELNYISYQGKLSTLMMNRNTGDHLEWEETKLGIGLTRLNRDFCPNFCDLFNYTVSLSGLSFMICCLYCKVIS